MSLSPEINVGFISVGGEDSTSMLGRDLLAQILARVDGPTLASASCASCSFNGIAKEDGLREVLCHSTWPSTMDERAKSIISSLHGGYGRFFANSFPFILYKPQEEERWETEETSCSDPSDLVSLVDVYYKDECIFSKVLYGIPGAEDDEQHGGWFMDGPFRLDALQYQYETSSINEDEADDEAGDEEDDVGTVPLVPLVEGSCAGGKLCRKGTKGGGKLCRKLEEKVRLSWVLLDTRTGESANLSSWKPLSVQRHWPSEGDALMHFGSIAAGGDVGPVECVISVKCRMSPREGCLQWRDICMQMEDKEGAHIDGRRSLAVLHRALRTSYRSRKHEKFELLYEGFMKEKREAREKRMRREFLIDKLFVYTGITLFAVFCHLLISLTQSAS